MNKHLLKVVACFIAFAICHFSFAATMGSINDLDLSTNVANYTLVSNNDDCDSGGNFSGFKLGDIAFTGYLCDGAHEYSFVLLVAIPAGTSINFTDRGWKAVGGFRDGEEDIVQWTSTTPLKAGTEVLINDLSASVGSITAITGNPLTFTDQGDQIFAYHGTPPVAGDESNFMAAIQMNGEWDANAGSERTSAKPSVFTDGETSISIAPEKDHAIYLCTTTSGTPSVLRNAINDKLNWDSSNLPIFGLPNCGFDVKTSNGGGLPCGFVETHINCDGNTGVGYDPGDETFTIKVDGCSHNGHGPDRAAFVSKELCGDGKIVARVKNFHGSGFAGLMVRESLDPLSRRLGALKFGYRNYVLKEFRKYYGGHVRRASEYRRNSSWIKLIRRGNTISAYTSRHGYYWRFLYRRSFYHLDQCIYFGLTAYAHDENSGVAASFDHVRVHSFGNSSFVNQNSNVEHIRDVVTNITDKQDLIDSEGNPGELIRQETRVKTGNAQLYPNPANQEVMIDLSTIDLQNGGLMELYNSLGQQLYQRKLSPFENNISRLDLQPYSSGVYYLRLQLPDGETTNLPLVIKR